ncbi:MAG: hypothetical protein AAF311_07225 [Pseudomonadota bacterium]
MQVHEIEPDVRVARAPHEMMMAEMAETARGLNKSWGRDKDGEWIVLGDPIETPQTARQLMDWLKEHFPDVAEEIEGRHVL